MDNINYIAFKGTVERWRAILTNSGCNGSYDYHWGHLQTYDYTTGSYTYVHCLGEAYTGN